MNLGVIVGRFQVPELHEGHIKLIDHVKTQFNQVVVLLGVSSIPASPRNPLDYITREKMIKEKYPDITVAPLADQPTDQAWSQLLDKTISMINVTGGKVILYGGRDSFKPFYSGRYDTVEIETGNFWSGTEMRKLAANEVIGSREFRHGVIYGLSNQFPRVFLTVDIAILRDGKVLLGKKRNEPLHRFPGGFVDQNDPNMETTAKREAQEETGVVCEDAQYLGSFSTRDWRYKHKDDGVVMTNLFASVENAGIPHPADDLDEVRWFDLNKLQEDDIMAEHRAMLTHLKANVPEGQRKLVTWTDKGR